MHIDKRSQWIRRGEYTLAVLAAIFFVCFSICRYAYTQQAAGGGRIDFGVFYAAGKMAAGYEDMSAVSMYTRKYILQVIQTFNPHPQAVVFLYPPPAAVMFIPLSLLAFPVGAYLWGVINLLCVVAALAIAIRVLIDDRVTRLRYSLFLCILAFSDTIRSLVFYGQINGILFLLLVGGFALLQRQKQILAGVVLATATVIKVFPALCVIHLFMQKQWKALITYFFTLIAWFLLAWPFFHSSGIMYFFTNRIPRFVRGDVGFMKESVSVFGSTRAAILQNDLAVFGQSTQALIEHLHRIAPYLSIVILGVSVFFLWKDRRHTQGNYWLHLYGVYIALLMLLPQATHLAFLLWITPVLLYWIHKVDVHNTRTWWYALLALCVGVVTQFWNIPHVYVAYRTILYMKLATVALVAMLACSLLALRRGHKHVV